MAANSWLGTAEPRAQVSTITIANTWAANDTVSVKIGSITLILTVGTAAATTDVATALKQAWMGEVMGTGYSRNFSGQDVPQFVEIIATINSSTVTLTGPSDGTPFEITVTESTAGDGTATAATTTAATGPHHWDNAANWSLAAVPANADEIEISRPVPIWYGLDQNALDLDLLNITAAFAGGDTGEEAAIGLPAIRNLGEDNEYPEYRRRYLKLEATNIHIGKGTGDGSGRICLELVDDTVVHIHKTGTALIDTDPAVFIKGGTNAYVHVYAGTVGCGHENGDALSLTQLVISGIDATPTVVCGNGGVGTANAVTVANGSLVLDCGTVSGLTVYPGGTVTHRAPATITTLILQGGTVLPQGALITYTTASVFDGGHLDASEMTVSGQVSWSTLTCYAGATVTIPNGVTFNNITLAVGVGITGVSVLESPTSLATLNLPIRHSHHIVFSTS